MHVGTVVGIWFPGQGLAITAREVKDALRIHKRRHVLDHYGCSAKGLLIVAEARPGAVAAVLELLACSEPEMQSIVIQGSVKAKKPGAVPPSKVRTILPLPVVLSTIDAIVAGHMTIQIDAYAATLPHPFLECARKHRQVLDAVFPLSLVIEKGLDEMSGACIAQSDIKQYYGHLSALKIGRWLARRPGCSGLASTFVRIHSSPQIWLRVGSGTATFSKRCIGVYTASRSAAAAGRIPLLDVAAARVHYWATQCYSRNGCQCALASFVDNLISTGPSPEEAINILEDCASNLASTWELSIGADSKEFMVCRGYQHDHVVPDGWKMQRSFCTLGHRIDDDAGISTCFEYVAAAMFRSYYGNASKGLRRSSKAAKLRFLKSSVQGIAQFRWSRWPFQRTYAKRLDGIQRKMLAHMFNITPHQGEPYDAFVQRRHVHSGHLASQCGRFSQAWAGSLLSWSAHVNRRHDTGTWSAAILDWHNTTWLTQRRLLHSSANESRTQTRAYRGCVQKRWEESLDEAGQVAI